ncbi:hypothetical protein DWW45_04490 [Sutterella sp. AF15-44LB]|nr:hypothetical protein DWW45_04490 [Sutterella sp. AF15-44LB]RHH08135.1 hypothetical protein DW229_02530 [Sutterella sp. AM18-8-1]
MPGQAKTFFRSFQEKASAAFSRAFSGFGSTGNPVSGRPPGVSRAPQFPALRCRHPLQLQRLLGKRDRAASSIPRT